MIDFKIYITQQFILNFFLNEEDTLDFYFGERERKDNE